MSKEIKLHKDGFYVTVDDWWFDELNKYHWYVLRGKGTWYACRRYRTHQGVVYIYMHRLITNAPKGELVDHKDGNGLNNQEQNLRLCSVTENNRNRVKTKSSSSGYKGVTWQKSIGKWKAQIMVDRKNIHIGVYTNIEDAAHAYDDYAVIYHGNFAKLNFPK